MLGIYVIFCYGIYGDLRMVAGIGGSGRSWV
jgi:hypothetical protein